MDVLTYQRRHSVMYRSGFQAGLAGDRPNKYSMGVDFYRDGYRAGILRRELTIAGLISATVAVIGLLTLAAFGF
ncbi:hypothetical protein [Mesorhizobium sp.]|uniref:hypothetical protein n=1 Tax=Mesorhizobium sp. TaxID=1871066 RepID=UPI000FE38922|nr:hypothetical protein [Mesorhizobium sp.]RWJ03485.1 MAG: hypothetical protein EOR24_32410 [Mesorhizobium sp.]